MTNPQEEMEITTEETEELTNEELAELINKAINEGKQDAELIRVIHYEKRFGGCGYEYLYEYGSYSVLLGEVEEVELDHSVNENECIEENTTAIIPKTKEVVIFVKNKDENPEYKTCNELLVFRYPVGWRSIHLCDDNIWM